LRDSAFFHSLAYIAKESDSIFMKIYSCCGISARFTSYCCTLHMVQYFHFQQIVGPRNCRPGYRSTCLNVALTKLYTCRYLQVPAYVLFEHIFVLSCVSFVECIYLLLINN